MLDENLFDNLEKVDQDKVLTALEKGFAKKRFDDSGIKLFGGAMEIKVLAKNQVFSQLGYVNPEDKILVIFNARATHEDIAIKALLFEKLPTTTVESILFKDNSEKSTDSDYQNIITFNYQVDPLGVEQQNKDYGDDV